MHDERFVLSGFADEIDDDLDTQLRVLDDLEISHLDLRHADGVNVADFGRAFAEDVAERLADAGVGVSSIGSPIGKIDITDDFAPHRETFEHVLDMADLFEADYVRLFSYYIPESDDPADHREEVMRRMAVKADLAAERDIVIVHENERDIYGDTPARCRDIFTTIDSDHLRMAFDPGNFVEVGVNPYPDALLQTVEFVEQLHVKDAIHVDEGRSHTPAGQGEGDIREVLRTLTDRGFRGYASLEPHLVQAGRADGYSGPEAYRAATDALVGLLDDIGATYQ
jgi:sugar phosphate isomerase/epimerase